MSDFGDGIYLTRQDDGNTYLWDIDVDETGDVRAVGGKEELLKDLAYQSREALGPIVGSALTQTTLGRIESTVTDVIANDARITTVIEVNATIVDDVDNEVEVVAEANSEDGIIELVFEVN